MQKVQTAVAGAGASAGMRRAVTDGIPRDGVAFGARTMFPAAMSVSEPSNVSGPASVKGRSARWLRPALGLLLPVALAAIWELVVYLGWSNGRLVPPPARIFATFVELAQSGELWRHTLATTL